MNINGIDVSGLGHKEKSKAIPTVPGRVVHIDGDFLAYMVAYDDSKSIEDMKHNCSVKAEKIRLMAGAETMQIHSTPKESNKGGRYEIALLREYQTGRKGKPKPKYLHLIRAYMHNEMNAIQHVDCEADDGMSMAQYGAIAAGNRNLSIIATKDKDLQMVPGLALDWDTGEITDTQDDFGYIRLDRDKAQPKIKGRGWKMFWAQMLTGDTADNISGLPMVCDLQYLPRGKHKACGPVLAYEILNPLTTNKEAFAVVKKLFYDYHNVKDDKGNLLHPFTNWRDGSIITPGQAFVSEAMLLWMRRNYEYKDVVSWLSETAI
jgi:hypothetical protein